MAGSCLMNAAPVGRVLPGGRATETSMVMGGGHDGGWDRVHPSPRGEWGRGAAAGYLPCDKVGDRQSRDQESPGSEDLFTPAFSQTFSSSQLSGECGALLYDPGSLPHDFDKCSPLTLNRPQFAHL